MDDLLEKAAREARSMYKAITDRYIPPMADIATTPKRVAQTRDLETFLCLGPHIQSILRKTVVAIQAGQRHFCLPVCWYCGDGGVGKDKRAADSQGNGLHLLKTFCRF